MKYLFLLGFYIFFSLSGFSQDWVRMSLEGSTFSEIRDSMTIKFRNKSFVKGSSNFEKSYLQYKRWETFWKYRVTEKGIPAHPALLWNSHGFQKTNNNNSADWEYFGPDILPIASSVNYPGAGRINAISFNPLNPDIIWVGSPSGGLWRTGDGGVTWKPYGDQLPNMGISDIVINPLDTTVIFIATGDADFSQNYSIGILKSEDGGISWDTTGLRFSRPELALIDDIYLNPSDTSVLLAATSNGIYKTSDAGVSWNIVDSLPSYQIESMPNSLDTLYASVENGVLRSFDSGNSWHSVGPILDGPKVKIAITQANSRFLLAIDASGNLFKSNNAGESWVAVGLTEYNSQQGYNMALAVSPIDSNLFLVGGVHGWRSTDGGANWEKYLNGTWKEGDPYFYVHQDHHVFKFFPNGGNIIFSGNDGGLHRGNLSASDPWEDLSEGLFITQYYGIGGMKESTIDNQKYLIGGAQDNDVIRTPDGDVWYNLNNNSDGIDGFLNYENPQIAFASSAFGFMTRTEDGWISVDTVSEVDPEKFDFVWPSKINPLNPKTIYAGGNELYVSFDEGDNWSTLTNGQTFGGRITEIAISPLDTNTIYLAYSSVLLGTSDYGNNWNYITIPGANKITGISVSDTSPQTIYVTVSGFTDGEKVFQSSNGGETWTNISQGVPNVPVNCIIYQSGTDQDLFIGTDIGVFYKNNMSDSFEPYSNNLPNVIIHDLEIDYSINKIRAATFGRGVWESNTNTLLSGNEPDFNNRINVNVYPNPSSGYCYLDFPDSPNFQGYDIQLINSAGFVVYNKKSFKSSQHIIDMNQLPEGFYFLIISKKSAKSRYKIILNR